MMVLSMLFLCGGRLPEVVIGDVCSKCDDGDAKSWEDVFEHLAVGEDGAFTPCLAFRPWITVELLGGHR
jgi:hypothetical protein